MKSAAPLSITGLGCLSTLGHDLDTHLDALSRTPTGFEPIGCLLDLPDTLADVPAGWIRPRSLLNHRKWSPSTCATLHVAEQALREAGWTTEQKRHAGIVFGTSRGSVAGWLEDWPDRRPFPIMQASNSLASEPAAAIAQELGIEGNWHVVSNGCCAGLDALGTAALWIRAGLFDRVLVASCDLPLTRPILEAYEATGILAHGNSAGMIPAEGAAALCLETRHDGSHPRLIDHRAVGEPTATLGTTSSLPGLRTLITQWLTDHGTPTLCLPHHSGTANHARHEAELLDELLGSSTPTTALKPYTGHCVGASGLLESVIACASLRTEGTMTGIPLSKGSSILKISSAMGGKHSVALFDLPHE